MGVDGLGLGVAGDGLGLEEIRGSNHGIRADGTSTVSVGKIE